MIFCVTIVDIEHLCHHSGIGIIEPLVIHFDGGKLNSNLFHFYYHLFHILHIQLIRNNT